MKTTIKFLATIAICVAFLSPSLISAYSVQPGDTLEIQILNKKELNTRQLVAPDGTISLPFIGRYTVHGKPLETLDDQLKVALGKYILHPEIVVQVDQIMKPDSKTSENFYVALVDSANGNIEVKTAKTIPEAMAWTGGNAYQAYRVNATGQKIVLKDSDKLVAGDYIVVIPSQVKTEPIYLAFYDQSRNLIDLKKAATVSEAMGWTAGKPYQLVKGKPVTSNIGAIEPGDTLIVSIGKPDDWWGDNWYKILTGAAVVIGLFNSLK
jgi:polysaccharide export outer membrane protein